MHRSMSLTGVILIAVLISAATLQAADLSLNRYFSDNMVLQRDKPLVIKGTAENGAEVTVEFAGQKKSGKADAEGAWVVTLDPVRASAKGAELRCQVSGVRDQVIIKDVVVGDVFVHARQTSIDISLGRDEEGKKVAAATKANPMFRAISIKAIPAAKPLSDLAKESTTGWSVVDKDSAMKMTASAYYLGRDLAKEGNVPIGIIDVNMGPAFGNSWLSREELLVTGRYPNDERVASNVTKYETRLEAELKGELEGEPEGELEGEPVGKSKMPPKNTLQDQRYPAAGYNGMLSPLAGTALKAVVVQLGNDYPYMRYQEILDSDEPADRDALNKAYGYVYELRKYGFWMEDSVIPRVTREWRKCLGDEDLPFGLIVPPGSDLNTLAQHHREMRELQRLIAEDIPGVGIILPGTENIPFSAQPADDELLAKRCVSWVEGAVYGKPGVPATGPLFDRFEADYDEATIHFKEGTAKGLKASGDALNYFEAANVEGDYYPVKARIDGETIKIGSDTGTRIARVRYNWKRRPDQGLINAAGLPAIPFRSERTDYEWLVRNEEDDWSEEYFTPANEWDKKDVTLINVALQNKGFENFSGWIGPAGFKVGPFGPNLGVGQIKEGSPADGKMLVGDVIYSANGKMLGDESWLVMAAAITESETRKGKGKLVLGVRRGTENIDVELTLEVMGTYSSTAPYDCPKTEKIVANLEKWVTTGGADDRGWSDFLGADTLFLLGTGNPEMLGYVRRAIYQKIAKTQIVDEIDPTKGPKAWYPAWDSLLLGEYYMATGDRNVLPYLKFNCDLLAAKQHPLGAWRHNFPGGDNYGLMPALGVAGAIGFHLANDAALDISQEAYRKVIKYYHDQAQMGRVIYGLTVGTPAPPEFLPELMNNGRMTTYNGAVASAGILSNLEGDTKTAHLCSVISAHAWNNTYEGHGGNFWNNFWTPLGAKVQGKTSFINFWKNYRWYRELARQHDGSLAGGGRVSAGYGLALVSPRERLQIVGAPASPFAKNAPETLKPALEAYWKKDYAKAQKLANELIATGSVELDLKPTVEYLARAAKEMQESFDSDFARMQKLIDAGKLYKAKTFLAGLEGVMAAGDERLVAMQKKLAEPAPAGGGATKEPASITADFASIKALVDAGELDAAKEYVEDLKSSLPKGDKNLVAMQKLLKGETLEADSAEKPRQWVCLVSEDVSQSRFQNRSIRRGPVVNEKDIKPNLWSMTVIEDMNQAPKGWSEPTFDDAEWLKTALPISWRMYHTALLRTQFDVKDKDRFDGLRLYSWILRQQNMKIYLNGELIAKVNGAGNTTNIEQEFKAAALKQLKNGSNTLAIETRHNWRWGHGGLSVYNNGFDFNLDARLIDDK